jgi:hypothetical protein
MTELIIGFGLGAMALTNTGREIGNKLGDAALSAAKRGLKKRGQKSAEQPAGTVGDDNHNS